MLLIFYQPALVTAAAAATSNFLLKGVTQALRNRDLRAKVVVPKEPQGLGVLRQKCQQRQGNFRQGQKASHYRKRAFMEEEGPQEAALLRSIINYQRWVVPCVISKYLQSREFLSLPHKAMVLYFTFSQCVNSFPFFHSFVEIKSKSFTLVSQ